jgi:hypothetical protein
MCEAAQGSGYAVVVDQEIFPHDEEKKIFFFAESTVSLIFLNTNFLNKNVF